MRCLRTILNAPRLPVEFQEVQYIESAGTQWLDTGVLPEQYNSIKAVLTASSTSTNKSILIGTNSDWNSTWLGVYNGRWTSNESSSSQFLANQKTTIEWQTNNIQSGIQNATIKVNGDTWSFQRSSRIDRISNIGISIFNSTQVNFAISAKLYELKLYGDDSLVRNFIPCYHKANGEVGLYDLVNGVFYTNAGTGDFIKGDDANRVVSSIKSQVAYSILPTEYKQLEYIQSDGNQYIDTGFVPNQDTSLSVKITDATIQSAHLLGSRTSAANKAFSLSLIDSTASTTIGFNTNIFNVTPRMSNIEAVIGQASSINESTHTFPSSQWAGEYPIYLFRLNQAGDLHSAATDFKLHYVIIKNGTQTVRNFIPAQRLSDNEMGLYDRVNGVFYTNAGSGSFTAGGEVDPTIISSNTLKLSTSRLPEIYQEVEYIESTGTQYIDTGVSPDNGTGLKVIFSDLTVANRDFNFIGSRLQGSSRFMINYTNGNFGYGWDGYYTTNENINISMKNTVELNFYNNRHFIANGNTLANLSTIAISNMPTIYIFGQHSQANNLYSYKVYECEITQDDLLIRKFIPCYRKSDNEIGLYDAKNGVFYTNAGTGTFIKGNNI